MKTRMLMGALLVSGCTYPAVTPNLPSSQYRMDRAVHWERLAERTVDAMIEQVAQAAPDTTGHMIDGRLSASPLSARPWYIRTSDSGFARSFTPMLQDALRKKGRMVALTPQNAVIVNYDVRTYLYGDAGRMPVGYATLGAVASTMGFIATNATSTAIATGAVGAVGLDILNAMSRTTRGEAILTASVVTKDRIVHQSSEAFYVHPANLPLYWSDHAPPMPTEPLGPVYEATRRIPVERL